MAILKREIKKAKKTSWENFVNGINKTNTTKLLWNKINKIKNNKNTGYNLLEDYDMLKKFMNENFPVTWEETDLPYNIENEVIIANNKFSIETIETTLKSKRDTAPGENRISYKLLKLIININPEINTLIAKHLNKIYDNQTFPGKWKISKIIIQ